MVHWVLDSDFGNVQTCERCHTRHHAHAAEIREQEHNHSEAKNQVMMIQMILKRKYCWLRGARVMLTGNLWTANGTLNKFCNGSG
jgi:hypothetical protein